MITFTVLKARIQKVRISIKFYVSYSKIVNEMHSQEKLSVKHGSVFP